MLEISYYKKKKMTNCISFFLWFVFIYIYIYIQTSVSFFFVLVKDLKLNNLWLMKQCRQGKLAKWIHNLEKMIDSKGWAWGPNPKLVGCRRTARVARAARAGRCVPTGGRTKNGRLGDLPWALNR